MEWITMAMVTRMIVEGKHNKYIWLFVFIDHCVLTIHTNSIFRYNHADNSGTDLEGDGSHGTHCAGTIAADNDNGVGVAGVAGGKGGASGASLMISTCFGATNTDGFAEALVYGADNGAHVSSNSWGYTVAGAYESSVLDAIDYADDAGVMIVFAAGNDGTDDDWYPAYYSTVIAVAAVDKDKTAAYFTNYGSWVDISGPGYPVLSTVFVDEGSYDYYSGTSMATPHVAGGLALAKSYMPSATSAEIVACLFSSALDIDSLNTNTYANKLGSGLMDIPAIFECLGTQSPTLSPAPTAQPIPSPTLSPVIPPTISPTHAPTVGPKSVSTCANLGWTNAEGDLNNFPTFILFFSQ
jgi:subtilisin family serine protease